MFVPFALLKEALANGVFGSLASLPLVHRKCLILLDIVAYSGLAVCRSIWPVSIHTGRMVVRYIRQRRLGLDVGMLFLPKSFGLDSEPEERGMGQRRLALVVRFFDHLPFETLPLARSFYQRVSGNYM